MTNEQAPTTPQHDSAKQRVALLIIDMINDFDFGGGRALHDRALATVEPILALRRAIELAGHPVIYVNDNFGEWHSERWRLVDRALERHSRVSEQLRPADDDYFIIKPQFSGFYATNLPVLLPKLGVDRLVLTGMAADICVLFTAADAHMRDYELWIPEDAVAARTPERRRWALEIMKQSMGAEVRPTNRLSLAAWSKQSKTMANPPSKPKTKAKRKA